jgi:diphthine-ammonia ligase
MKVASLFSGGKDSVYSIYVAQQWGWDITHLVTLEPEQKDSWMFHSVNIGLTTFLSTALGIPLIRKQTSGEKETELNELKDVLINLNIDGVISGAIASEYQRTRIEQICHELNLKSFTPLWHKNQEMLLRDMVSAGFSVLIVGVFAHGFDESWLGKPLNEQTIDELLKIHEKYQINLAGEGGEFETLVLDGPIFSQKLVIDQAKVEWKRDHGIYQITKAHLENKV